MSRTKIIVVDNVDGAIPGDARQEVADAVHDILRENHDIRPGAVWWEEGR